MGHYGARARLHLALLAELVGKHEIGGQVLCRQFISSFPTLGNLAEPGVCPVHTGVDTPSSREKLFNKKCYGHAIEVREGAVVHVGKGLL